MKKISSFPMALLLLVAGVFSCNNPQKEPAGPKIVKLWETEAVFKVPESVFHDPVENFLYVSNINGNPTDKDSNGFISKCLTDGTVIDLDWATGLHAPKGMGIAGEHLYSADIDRVAKISLQTGEIIRFFEVPGASFLNDIAVDPSGNVYISDMMDTKIYRISGDSIGLWLDDPALTGPNGLYVEENHLLIGCKKIMKAGLGDASLQEWLLETGSIDGLEATGDGSFLFSDWKGNVYIVDKGKKIEKILDLTTEQKNAADIEFDPLNKILYVPTFGAGTVIAYELNQ